MNVEVYDGEVRINGTTIYQAHEVREPQPGPVVHDAQDVVSYLKPWENANQESFIVLLLNGANRVIKAEKTSTGTLNMNQVHPRDVFRPAIVNDAASVILAHNHPSGALEASPEDIAITERLKKAGELLGIKVLDHVIVSSNGFVSLKQQGIM